MLWFESGSYEFGKLGILCFVQKRHLS